MKPAPPPTGTCKIVEKWGQRFLEIVTRGKTTYYKIDDLHPDPRVADPAWRLTKEDGESYDVGCDEYGPFCSCADSQYRRRACKHIQAAQAVGLLPKEFDYARP